MTERHAESNCHEHGQSPVDGEPRVGRRSYLKLAGAAVGSPPSLTSVAGARTAADGVGATRTPRPNATTADALDHSVFSRTVDAVAAGCDPTGETPCDDAFRRMVGDDTFLSFPSGTYRFTRPQVVLGVENLGLVGRGDVTFLAPPNFNGNLLTIAGGARLAFAGIDVDVTAPGSTPGLRLCAHDSLTVEDVTFRGRGTHPPTDRPVANALSPVVRSPNGRGTVRNVVARNGGSMGAAYRRPAGRAGIWVGSATRGTVTIEDCHLDGFPGGGVYASETSGRVRVKGGSFRDNDIAGIRLGGAGRIENARVEAGVERRRSARGGTDACAIRLEGGGSGAEIANCDVAIGPDTGGAGAIVAAHDYGGFTLRDTRVRAIDRPAVRGLDPEDGYYSPPQGSLGTRFERCAIVGSRPRIRLTGRPVPRFVECSFDDSDPTRASDARATDRDRR